MTAMRGLTAALLLGAALVTLPGCGGSQSEVSGTVLVDGKPLQEGEIIFEAADGKVAPASGTIKDGKYTAQVLPGPKKVKVTASRPAKRSDKLMGSPGQEAMIRPEYNERTTLTADVKSGKQDNVNFEVKALR